MRVIGAPHAPLGAAAVLREIMTRYWWVYVIGFAIRAGIIVCSSILDAEHAAAAVVAGRSPYDRGTYRYSPLLAYLLLPNAAYPEWGKVLFAACDIVAALFSAAALMLWRASPGSSSENAEESFALHKVARIRSAVLWSSLYLFSPLAINISTRGSADAIVIALLFLLLLLLLPLSGINASAVTANGAQAKSNFAAASRAVAPAAIVFGLVVHFRVYPVIYAPAILLFLAGPFVETLAPSEDAAALAASPRALARVRQRIARSAAACMRVCTRVVTSPHCLAFTAISAGVFATLFVVFYAAYGWTFAFETYLYHFSRKDIRHNFSPYFYPLYLSSAPQHALPLPPGVAHGTASPAASTGGALVSWLSAGAVPDGTGLLASVFTAASRVSPAVYVSAVQAAPVFTVFMPQIAALLLVAVALHAQLPACFLVQTLMFVTLNKVCTAQYFLWWSSYLPLVAPALAFGATPLRAVLTGAAAAALWQGTEAFWLYWGYKLEHLSEPVFVQMWLSSLLFFAVNIALGVRIIARTRAVGIAYAPAALPWECAPAQTHTEISLGSEATKMGRAHAGRLGASSSEPSDATDNAHAAVTGVSTVRARVRGRALGTAEPAPESGPAYSRTRSRARAVASSGAAARSRGTAEVQVQQPRAQSRSQSRVRSRAGKGGSRK